LDYLVEKRQRKGVKLVLSLFARANDQYLFPGSVENKSKHVSDDRQLVKWWCRVLDPVLRKHRSDEEDVKTGEDHVTSQAYLIVPGEDSILPYLPQDVRFNPILRRRWKHGHALREISRHPAAPPRCLVPHFPDDPKARFLVELDDELPEGTSSQVQDSPSKRGNGQWRSVRSLEQFWEMMAYRQECSSGRLVGFIWIVFTPSSPDTEASHDTESLDSQASLKLSQEATDAAHTGLASPPTSQSPPRNNNQKRSPHPRRPATQRRTKALKGPIIPRMPKIKSASSTAALSTMTESKYYTWPATSRGEILLNEKDYTKATERLLALQFKSEEAAAASTKAWVEEVAVLAGGRADMWGQVVVGRKVAVAENGHNSPPANDANGTAVNTLGVKRKADAITETQEPASNGTVNTLGSGLVKKKKKKIQPQ
jgi:regulator of Ty1 transposition protein 109